MPISTNGTVIVRLAGGLYNTVISNGTYNDVSALDPSALANTLYSRDFAKATDLDVAKTLVTNLGLTSVTGLDNWVAAQLTAAGTGNKGAKVVSLLNDFASMTADTTYGALATAFNAKVDAALASSQKAGSVEGKFATAGVVAVTDVTFALTAGVDAFVGGAGNDTVTATVANLGALDTIDGGAGVNTLTLSDALTAVTSLGGATITNVQKLNITAASVGTTYSAATTAAVSAQAAQAQVAKIAVGASDTYATTNVVTFTIGNAAYTFNPTGTTASSLATNLRDQIRTRLGDDDATSAGLEGLVDVEIDGTVNTTVNVTSKKAGTALPAITVAVATSTSVATAVGTQTVTASSTANKSAVGPGAIGEVLNISMAVTNGVNAANDLAAGDIVYVNVNGVDYAVASTGSTATTAGAAVASAINSALGSTTAAINNSGVVTVTAPVAGTALPYINVRVPDATGTVATYTQVVGNQQASTAAVGGSSAAAVAAVTGVTDYKVVATGDANVTGVSTSAIDVSGATVQTSGGTSVKVVATKAVGVSSATGAVSIATSDAGSGSVINTAGTGASTTGYGSGMYVTGGTTVSATQRGGTISSTTAAVTANSNAIKVGVNPTEVVSATLVTGSPVSGAAKTSATATFYGTVAGLSSIPTGDVTVSASSNVTIPSITGTIANGSAGKTSVAYGAGTTSVFTNGATTASLTGFTTGTVTDVNTQFVQKSATDTTYSAFGTSKLATVNLTGVNGTATITSDAISTVNVLNAVSPAQVVIANSGTTGANSGAFNLSVGNSTVRVDNNTATSVNVSTSTTSYETLNGTAPVTNSNALTLNAAKATSLSFSNASSVALTVGSNGALPSVATITASGSASLNLGSLASGTLPKLTTVSASGATGAITASIGATNSVGGLSFTSGSGNDVVTVAGNIAPTTASVGGGLVTTSIALGAGNDTLLNSSGTVAAGATVDAGDGTDTLDLTLVNAGNSAIFRNFERLAIKGAADATVFDASLLTNSTISGLNINGNLASGTGITVTNLPGTSYALDVTASSTAVVVPTLTTSSGTADAANLNFAASVTAGTAQTVTLAGLKVAGIETVNVSSGGSLRNTTDFTAPKLTNALTALTDAGNVTTSVVVTGANGFNLGAFTNSGSYTSGFAGTGSSSATADVQSALTSIDASAVTGPVTIVAGTTTTFTGAASTTRNFKFDGLTIKGGTGADTLVNDAAGGVTQGGDGNDTIYIKGGATTASVKASADGGAGNDTIVVLGSVATNLTGGAGNDTFNAAAATAGSATSPVITAILDAAAGDSLVLAATGVTAIVSAQSAIASATSLNGAFTAALAANSAAGATGALVTATQAGFFTYGGFTYVVLDDGNDGFGVTTTNDIIVRLTGTVDLSTATVANNTITLG